MVKVDIIIVYMSTYLPSSYVWNLSKNEKCCDLDIMVYYIDKR